MLVPEGTGCVNHYQIEVAMESAVLKPVIHQNDLGAELRDGRPRRRDAVGLLNMRYVGQALAALE